MPSRQSESRRTNYFMHEAMNNISRMKVSHWHWQMPAKLMTSSPNVTQKLGRLPRKSAMRSGPERTRSTAPISTPSGPERNKEECTVSYNIAEQQCISSTVQCKRLENAFQPWNSEAECRPIKDSHISFEFTTNLYHYCQPTLDTKAHAT